MLDTMYHGGRVALLGLIPNGTAIDWDKVIFKGLHVKGIYGREIFETWYKMEAMIRSHLDIGPVITHRFVFDDFQKGFDAMLSGESGKGDLELMIATAIGVEAPCGHDEARPGFQRFVAAKRSSAWRAMLSGTTLWRPSCVSQMGHLRKNTCCAASMSAAKIPYPWRI